MVPFVLNDYVAKKAGEQIPFATEGFDVGAWFDRVELVKPTPFAPSPDTSDGVVYTDEHIDFLRRQFDGDILAPGPTQLMIGSDNKPDLYVSNFPMLQRGNGAALYAANGVKIGNRLTADDFTKRFIRFASRVKGLWPSATIVGPDHFHFDGYTNFHTLDQDRYTDDGRWYMDDFLADVRAESERDLGYAYGGFQLLRNADGAGLRFGGTSVKVVHPEKAESSVYAALDGERVTVLVINKTRSARRFGVRLFHDRALRSVDVHRVDAEHVAPALVEHRELAKTNAHAYEAPPLSATMLVFR